MSITFDNYRDAKDYQKMKAEEGLAIAIKQKDRKFVAIISGKSKLPREKQTGSGSFELLEGKGKLPSLATRREMDRYNISYDIDPEISSILLELNKKGYKTIGSCAGHKNSGYITFQEKGITEKDLKEIKEILEKKELILTNPEAEHAERSYYAFTFKPVGKYLSKKDEVISRQQTDEEIRR